MTKLYLVCSQTADNFILLDDGKDTYAASCAPSGTFDDVGICTNEFRRPEQIVEELREAISSGVWFDAGEIADEIRDILAENEPFMSEYMGFRRCGQTFTEIQKQNNSLDKWKKDVYYEI